MLKIPILTIIYYLNVLSIQITIDDEDEAESDKKEEKVEEEKSAKVSPANSQV